MGACFITFQHMHTQLCGFAMLLGINSTDTNNCCTTLEPIQSMPGMSVSVCASLEMTDRLVYTVTGRASCVCLHLLGSWQSRHMPRH